MKITLPHTIKNGLGETIIFKKVIAEPDGNKVILEGRCEPEGGPLMHVHYLQDEAITIVQGKMGYQILGQYPVF